MVKNNYKLRKKVEINYGEKSPQSLMEPFSSGSSDEVQFSDHSSDYSSDSNLETNCGYLEVSLETLKQKLEQSKTDASLIDKETATGITIHSNILITDDKNDFSLPLNKSFPEAEEQLKDLKSPSESTFICSDSEESGPEYDILSILSGLRKTPSPKLSDVSPDILLAKTIYYNSQNATLTSQETCEPQDNESSISSLNHQKVSCVENLNTKSIIMKEKRQGSEFGSKPSAPKESVSNNVDSILNNFGSIIKDDKVCNLELIDNHRRWTKKNCCPYCFLEVTHFPRHLQRNHEDEGAGNFALNAEKIRPVRRPRTVKENEEYFTCNYCLGFLKKMYLRKHRKKCAMNNCPQRKERTIYQSHRLLSFVLVFTKIFMIL
ncbi:hypothetical protein NQ318_023375 [Aromia moschata]|uniref:C2H2-type domain-containing protein n=1 Tax=Aromia moschata TaxID=1265417 RepID=A0AAV8X1Q5_9CUCU|nr:hypothetical protein NQ318_023375 [Aromia moschata]